MSANYAQDKTLSATVHISSLHNNNVFLLLSSVKLGPESPGTEMTRCYNLVTVHGVIYHENWQLSCSDLIDESITDI